MFTFEVADVPQMSKKAFNGPQIYIKKLGDELKNQKGKPLLLMQCHGFVLCFERIKSSKHPK